MKGTFLRVIGPLSEGYQLRLMAELLLNVVLLYALYLLIRRSVRGNNALNRTPNSHQVIDSLAFRKLPIVEKSKLRVIWISVSAGAAIVVTIALIGMILMLINIWPQMTLFQ